MATGGISRSILRLALLLSIAACEGGLLSPETSDPPIRTSADEYLLEATSIGWQTEIAFVYANRSDRPYYLSNCGGSYFYVLEKLVEGRWVVSWRPILPLCRSPVIRIDAGRVLADTVGVFGGFPGSNFHPQFQTSDPQGIYRIVVEALGSYDEDARPVGRLLRREQRVSNEFRLVAADSPTD